MVDSQRRAHDGRPVYSFGQAPLHMQTANQLRDRGLRSNEEPCAYVEGTVELIPLYDLRYVVPR